jgi:hypothetical protein
MLEKILTELSRSWQQRYEDQNELTRQRHPEIAAQVKRYVDQMPKLLTEKEYIATNC